MSPATIISLDAKRTAYNVCEAAQRTCTVGQLIEFLSQFNSESPIVLSHDEGYTFGEISLDYGSFSETEYDDDEPIL